MKSRLFLIAIAALSAGAFAQGNPFMDMLGGGGSSAPQKGAWTEFKLPKKTMKLDFRNASADMVLSLFTKTSGISIIKDPALTAPLSLASAKAVPLNEAFEILNAALSVRNFEMKKEGNLLVIRAKRQQNMGGGRQTTFDPSMLSGLMGGGNGELKVYPIQFANASQVARVINEVFAQSNNPMSGIMQMVMASRGGGRGGFGGGGSSTVKASSDDYSNSVIVNAPKDTHRQVEDLIKQIDKQTDEPQKAKVYKMKYASASDLQPVVQGVLTANLPRGRGGVNASQQNQGGGGPFGFFGGGGGGGQNAARNQLLQGAVVTDQRTNSLVVTTTDKNHILVDEVIKTLDTEVKLESTTFVFPLENARADQIATLMRQAFGQRQGVNGGGNTGRNNTGTGNTGRTNTNTGRTGGGGGNGGGLNLGGNNNVGNDLELGLVDPNLNAGELETNVAVQGGGIFGQLFGGGQQNQNNQNRQNIPLGRDQQGRLVPVQDMTNQITVIPDQNTNSIIVVTTPENAEMLRQILAQLDRIPEQVMIETMIVEATLDNTDKMGIEWQAVSEKFLGSTGVTGTGNQSLGLDRAGQGFRYTLAGGNLTAFMNALKTDSKFNVLSTPKIFTSNNVQAEINISQRVPFVVSQRTDANGNITFNYDFQDVGIVLNVTPRITSGGYVTMEVSQTANDLQGFTDFNAPIVNQRQAQTTVAVKDGETVVLGGIMRTTVSSTVKKIPLLGDIPVLGNLFKSTDKTKQKTELMVFLTPRVVRNPEDASKLTDEEKKKLSKPTQDQINKSKGGSVKANDTGTKKAGGI